MENYIVISSHTADDCHLAVDHFMKYHAGFLTHFEWGCYDNDHHAYTFIEAGSHDEAKMSVPPLFRDKAKVIKVNHMIPEMNDPHI